MVSTFNCTLRQVLSSGSTQASFFLGLCHANGIGILCGFINCVLCCFAFDHRTFGTLGCFVRNTTKWIITNFGRSTSRWIFLRTTFRTFNTNNFFFTGCAFGRTATLGSVFIIRVTLVLGTICAFVFCDTVFIFGVAFVEFGKLLFEFLFDFSHTLKN